MWSEKAGLSSKHATKPQTVFSVDVGYLLNGMLMETEDLPDVAQLWAERMHHSEEVMLHENVGELLWEADPS